MRGVNLIPIDRIQAKRLRRRVRRWTVGILVYGGALLIFCLLSRISFGQEHDVAAGELRKLTMELSQARARRAALTAELRTAEIELRTARALSDQPDWSILLSLLGDLSEEDVVLRGVRLAPLTGGPSRSSNDYGLEIRGIGRDQQVVSQFVMRLQQAQLFDEARLVRSAREPFFNNSAIAFEVHCTLCDVKEGPP